MALFEQSLVAGLGVGAVYALVAYGISLVWSVSKTLNFAHGDVLMVGVFASLVALTAGASGPVALLLAVAVAVLLGVVLEKAVFYPLRERPGSLAWVLGVVIFAAILRNAGILVFESRSYPLPFALGGDAAISIPGGAVFRETYLWVIGIALGAAAGLEVLMSRTAFGRAVRAVAHSRPVAELMGVNSERVMTATFALAAGIGALAGLLIAPLTFVSVSLGWLFTLKGFAAAVLGGIGKARGALAGGLVLGIVENLAAPWVAAGYRDVIAFALLIAVLVARPEGLLQRRSRWA